MGERDKQSKTQKFESLFERYYDAMMSTALRILRNERDAEDAVQQACESLFINIDKIERVGGFGCSTFVLLTVERKALDIRKAQMRRRETPIDDVTEIGATMSFPGDNPVEDAIASLPPRDRQAILLRFGMGYSVKEVAKIMEMSYSAAQMLIWRAREQLKEKLSEEGEFANE